MTQHQRIPASSQVVIAWKESNALFNELRGKRIRDESACLLDVSGMRALVDLSGIAGIGVVGKSTKPRRGRYRS